MKIWSMSQVLSQKKRKYKKQNKKLWMIAYVFVWREMGHGGGGRSVSEEGRDFQELK